MPRCAALDASFLLALAAGDGECESTMDSLQRGSRIPIITETIWEQLGALKNTGNPVYSHYAALALSQLTNWLIHDQSNVHSANGTSDVLAERLHDSGIIKGASVIQCRVIVEASCHDSEFLVSCDPIIQKADPVQLDRFLVENGLNTLKILNPSA